jgi:DNA-binding transcriptional regulator YhcF (GntR family)
VKRLGSKIFKTFVFFRELPVLEPVERLVMKENSPDCAGRTSPELPELQELMIEEHRSETKAALVLKLLRQTAAKCQNDHSHPFYPVRAVAERFGISPATVSRVYQRLSAEHLLRLIWGSKTLLEPVESANKTRPHRVAIPVELSRFITSGDYREAILCLQRELWNHRVGEHLIFFGTSADEVLHLCKRYHVSGIDTVIWIYPESVGSETLLALSELGMRVICVAARPNAAVRESYTVAPGCTISKIVREKILKL